MAAYGNHRSPPKDVVVWVDDASHGSVEDKRRHRARLVEDVLGSYLGEATAWTIDRSCRFCGHARHGKPRMLVDGRPAGVHFNVAHSGALVVVAVSRACDVGVDVEVVRGDFDWAAVAARVFTAAERRAIHKVGTVDANVLAYQTWVAKEAVLKGEGVGLAGPLQQVDTTVAPGRLWRGWQVEALDVGPGAVAAVAAAGPFRVDDAVHWRKTANSN